MKKLVAPAAALLIAALAAYVVTVNQPTLSSRPRGSVETNPRAPLPQDVARCPLAVSVYGHRISPTAGSPGSTTTMWGPVEGPNKAGITVHDSRVQLWWNLDPNRFYTALPGLGPPVPLCAGPVLLLGQEDVRTVDTYRLSFQVPNVRPGVYTITAVYLGGHGASGAPTALRVVD